MTDAAAEMNTARRLREIMRMLCGSVSSETGDDYVVDGDDDYMEDDGVDGGRSFVRGEVGRGVGEMWRERFRSRLSKLCVLPLH